MTDIILKSRFEKVLIMKDIIKAKVISQFFFVILAILVVATLVLNVTRLLVLF